MTGGEVCAIGGVACLANSLHCDRLPIANVWQLSTELLNVCMYVHLFVGLLVIDQTTKRLALLIMMTSNHGQ